MFGFQWVTPDLQSSYICILLLYIGAGIRVKVAPDTMTTAVACRDNSTVLLPSISSSNEKSGHTMKKKIYVWIYYKCNISNWTPTLPGTI